MNLTDKEINDIASMRSIWIGMISRCYSPKNKSNYKNYGGRGITVCDRWRTSFPNFVRDMWPRPKGMTLDRKDNNGNYSKENCKWSSSVDQVRNRRITRYVTLFGERRSVPSIVEEYKINYHVFLSRIDVLGWTPEQAVELEVRINPQATRVNVNGKDEALNDVAAKNGLSNICLRKRIQGGLTLKDAIAKPLEGRGGKASLKRVVVGGKEGTIKGFAKEHGLDPGVVYARVRQLGWALEEALEIVPHKRKVWNKGKAEATVSA